MTATSATGTGNGAAKKLTSNELAILANGPKIYFTGIAASDVEEAPASPPASNSGSVTFPYALEGGSANYVVLLTSISGGYVYVTSMNEDEDGNVTGFDFITEVDSDVMYMVASVGVRPVIVQA